MALTASAEPANDRQKITFWFGCNMLRHAELIRLSILLLERAGFDVSAAGGPGNCCGTAHDHQPKAAANMAARTVATFNTAARSEGRDKLVTWCPSCHMHMTDIMAPANPVAFDMAHVTELLADHAERLVPHMTVATTRRVLLHRHHGFTSHVPVNDRVRELLARIPGIAIVDGPAQAGHMCSSLAGIKGALSAGIQATRDAALASGCDTIATIFHSCHREYAAIDGADGLHVKNWVHLVAESMGLAAQDAYLAWRTGGTPDPNAIARANPDLYKSLIEPELRKPSPIASTPG